jgi:phage-related protein
VIPCLYDSREMKFDHNGIGKLADAQSCTVTEKRNGSYELKLICPADGIHAEMLEEGNIILAIRYHAASAVPNLQDYDSD